MAVYNEVYLVRLAVDPVVYLWSGAGDIETPPDAVDPGGATWRGAGELLSIPDMQQMINGTADRVEYSLSGVSAEIIDLALGEAAEVEGAELRLGSLALDAALQPSGGIEWERKGRADVVVVRRDGDRRTVTLSIGFGSTARSRRNIAFFTDADQRRRSPTDKFFLHTAQYGLGATRRFGPSD